MRVTVRFRDLADSPAARADIERALQRALAPHASRVLSVRALLRPGPPMQGPGRSSCRIRLRLRDGRSLNGEDHASLPAEAAVAAASRLAQRLELMRALPAPWQPRAVTRRTPIEIGGKS